MKLPPSVITSYSIHYTKLYEWDDTPNQFGSAMTMDPTTPVFRDKSEWVDNEYNNYARSHNNQTWNPVASIARANSHSREYGVSYNFV